jgi:hypothetical protein
MKHENRPTITMLTLAMAILAGGSDFTITYAATNGSSQVRPRIGLKSEAVVHNDLKQMGLASTDVTILGEMAKARVPINGEMANIEIDRQTGTIRILQASPTARQFIESRVPQRQLLPTPGLSLPAHPVKPNPGIGVMPKLNLPDSPIRK